MANLLFTFELARRLENTGITVNAIHPGLARSGLMKETFILMRLFVRLASSPPEKVTGAILQAATAPEFAGTSGKFFHNAKEIEAPAYAHDRAAQQRLWEMSEALTGLTTTKGELPSTDPQF
jgi:NAD(P)-dependent dehydrogenase (short-subunit alcohol dehydrogenase family)